MISCSSTQTLKRVANLMFHSFIKKTWNYLDWLKLLEACYVLAFNSLNVVLWLTDSTSLTVFQEPLSGTFPPLKWLESNDLSPCLRGH